MKKTNENGAALVTIIILVLLIIISIEVGIFFHAKNQKQKEMQAASASEQDADAELTVGEAQDETEEPAEEKEEEENTNEVSAEDTKVKNEVKNETKTENKVKDTNTTKTQTKKTSSKGKELDYIKSDVKKLEKVYSDDEFDVYTFGGEVVLKQGESTTDLKDALESGAVKISSITKIVKSDAQANNCRTNFYSDGGSTEYIYKDVTILVTNRLLEEKHSIVFAVGTYGADGILNTFDRLLTHEYTGSEYEKGLGEQAKLLHKAYDNLWIIDDGRKAMFYIKPGTTEVIGDIEEGDTINIVYSGSDAVDLNNRFYEYSKYTKSGNDYIKASINYYKNKPSNEEVIEKTLVKKLGDRLWVIDDPNPTDYSKGWVYIQDSSSIIGDIKEGDTFYITSGTVAMSGTGYVELKDVYKVEKAE